MGQSDRSLSALGKRVADLQDRAPEAQLDHDRGRARLLSARRPEAPSRARPAAWVLAATLAAALVILLVRRPREALRFEVGEGERGSVGAWVAAPPTATSAVRFSDGSRLVLTPAARARVTAVDADGAEIHLERGALEASVVHRSHTRWAVRGGPFLVRVIGTRFTLAWDPAAERLDLTLHEGAVTLSGPVVGEARAVRAGERLSITAPIMAAPGALQTPEGRLEVGPLDASTTALPPSSANPGAPPPVTRTSAPPRPAASGAPTAAPAAEEAPGWRSLAEKARYKEALAAAEAEGFDTLCAAAAARDLRRLGDVARLGGSPARAHQAFTTLRSRFPGSSEAAAAAFLLGRAAQDGRRDHGAAAAWFTRYLGEAPGGEFAAQAAGRLVEARDALGDQAGARAAAERYLATYPGGAHAAYARSVLSRGASGPP